MKTVYPVALALAIAVPILALANPNEPVGPVKPVEVVNDVITVEGVVGVDVLSVPDDSIAIADFVSAAFVGNVWGLNPTRDVLTPFDGILASVQVQLLVNGVLLRDSGDPGFRQTDVTSELSIFAVTDGQQRILYRGRISQSNDHGASAVVQVPNLDLRPGGAIRTVLEGPPDNDTDDIPGGSPVCSVAWTALGRT